MKAKTKPAARRTKTVVAAKRRRPVRLKPTAGAGPLSRKDDLLEPGPTGPRRRTRSATSL